MHDAKPSITPGSVKFAAVIPVGVGCAEADLDPSSTAPIEVAMIGNIIVTLANSPKRKTILDFLLLRAISQLRIGR